MDGNFERDHYSHDTKWIFSIDQTVACVACLIQTLENQHISRLKKTPPLAVLSKLVQTSPVIQNLRSEQNISCHIIHVILETLLQTEDTTFITSASEVCLKLIQHLDSEDIVDFMIQHIGNSIEIINSHKELLPLYVFIGRIVQKFPEISDKFLQNYEPLISKICGGLCCPEEDVQSAIMFIMVYIFEGDWEDHLSPRQLTQLCEDLVCVLNTAKTQILMMNSLVKSFLNVVKITHAIEHNISTWILDNVNLVPSSWLMKPKLGLLTKLLQSDKWLKILLSLTVDGMCLLTVLKKMIASPIEVVQQLSIQILSCVVERDVQQEYCFNILQSDLVEFLFEKLNTRNTQNIEYILKCLLPLCQLEVFYTRNHSVYGIEVLLKTLHTLKTMNHFMLTKKVLEIISFVFERQPSKSPLFVNSTTLKLCIDVVMGVVDHSHPGVFLAALEMTRNFFRKDHMLRPVPVSELKRILEKMTTKVQTFASETGMFDKKESGNKLVKISSAYCEAVLSAGRLFIDCKDDPSTCLSAFLAPDVVDNKGSTIDSLGELVVQLITQTAIYLAVNLLEETVDPTQCCLLFQILNCLQKLDPLEYKNTIVQLTNGGILSKAISIRCFLRDSHTDLQVIDPCLLSWFIGLYEVENKDGCCPGELEIDVNNITVKIEDVANHLRHSYMNKGTVHLYCFLLYHCYRNENIILPSDQLMYVLENFAKEYEIPSELSPLVIKQFVFLWAILTCMTENVVELPEKGLNTVLHLIRNCVSSVWYTHHQALIHWSFKDSRFVKVCGQNVLHHWLEEVDSKNNDITNNGDVLVLYQMFSDTDFLSCLSECISSTSARIGKLIVDLLENYLSQLTDNDEKGIFLLTMTAIIEEKTLEIFLQPDKKPEDLNVQFYLQILLMCTSQNRDDISSSFLKILYHITAWIDDNKDKSTIISCLQLLEKAIFYSPTRVVNLMVNSYKFMTLLNNLLQSSVPQLINGCRKILSVIILNTKGHEDKALKTVNISLSPIDEYVTNNDTMTTYLQLLSALLQVEFTSSIVNISNIGRNPSHFACPLTSRDIKVLFIYLQQLVLQDINDVKVTAVQCIEDLLLYLNKYSPKLVSDILKCSWNRLLFDVLITITVGDLSSLNTTLQLLNIILKVDEKAIIFKENSDLHRQLQDFIKCIDIEDVENKDILHSIKNKIL